MGGKSRKTGTISKKFIERLKNEKIGKPSPKKSSDSSNKGLDLDKQ